MPYYWVTMKTGRSGTVEAKDAEAASSVGEEATGDSCADVETLPYAAKPYLHQINAPDFCSTPRQCKGHTSCPKSYSCTN